MEISKINHLILTKKADSIVSKINHSENLILYFSEKYGDGDFNVFLNENERNKISKELIKREINTLEKSIKKNNKNTRYSFNGLNDKNIIENSNRFVNCFKYIFLYIHYFCVIFYVI